MNTFWKGFEKQAFIPGLNADVPQDGGRTEADLRPDFESEEIYQDDSFARSFDQANDSFERGFNKQAVASMKGLRSGISAAVGSKPRNLVSQTAAFKPQPLPSMRPVAAKYNLSATPAQSGRGVAKMAVP